MIKKEEESSSDRYHKTKESISQKWIFSEGDLEESTLFSRTVFDTEGTEDGK